MQTAIITSTQDQASQTIKKSLLKKYSFKPTKEKYENNLVYKLNNIKIYETKKESIYCENIDQKIQADHIIFATKHKSETNRPCLTTHTPGNWGKAEMGGKPKTLCTTNASLLKETFQELNKQSQNLKGYEATLECDHHGPETNKPTMFIEIGSNEKQWNDKKAGEAIAKTIMNTLNKKTIQTYETVFAIGSSHYPQPFNKVLLRTNLAIGHICPKYALKFLDKEMIKQAIEKTKEKVNFILLDWKGLGEEKARITQLLEELKLDHKRVQHLLK